ncbi:MAG: response regulator [Chloroflexi bacterium]|nr:response regulator [Chloroflexota bacterium]
MPTHVLLVDPSITFMLRLRDGLETQDFLVRTVGSPALTINALDEQSFDIAIVDVHVKRVEQVIDAIHDRQPDLPIILSGHTEKDPEAVNAYGAQAYIHKPYLARDIIPIITRVLTQQQGTDLFVPQASLLPAEGKEVHHELEAEEPPVDEETTIGDIFANFDAIDLEEEMEHDTGISSGESPQPLPSDASNSPQSLSQPAIPEPPHSSEDSAAIRALRVSMIESVIDRLLTVAEDPGETDEPPTIRPLPSWEPRLGEEQLMAVEALIGEIPPLRLVLEDSDADHATAGGIPPHSSVTQPLPHTLPEVDLLPEDEDTEQLAPPLRRRSQELNAALLDALAEAESLDDPRLHAALQEATGQRQEAPGHAESDDVEAYSSDVLPEDEELVPRTIEEITQSMGVVLIDEQGDDQEYADEEPAAPLEGEPQVDPEDTGPDIAAVDELLDEIDVIASPALQLTQYSLESSAIATLLTRQHEAVARSGDLPEQIWQQILAELEQAWDREGNPNTRALYRDLPEIGHILLFSTRTVDDLTLTMIFSADTPLRVIRRQASRLAEALDLFPQTEEEQAPTPSADQLPADTTAAESAASSQAEPPAAATTPSRPTDLRPPEDMEKHIQRDTTADKAEREPGTYMGYAFLWLFSDPEVAASHDHQEALQRWLSRTADANDWDIIDLDIGARWINLQIEVPIKSIPGEIVYTLKEETQQHFNVALGNQNGQFGLWSEGYSVTTPGRLFEPHEIERFIRYYEEQVI